MSCAKAFTWVTHAASVEQAEAALVLGKSLRVSGTRGQLVLIAGSDLPPLLRKALELVFDGVVPFQRKFKESWISPVLSAIDAGHTQKLILLDPFSIALGNPDFFEDFTDPLKVSEGVPLVLNRALDLLTELGKGGNEMEAEGLLSKYFCSVNSPKFASVDLRTRNCFGDWSLIHLKNFNQSENLEGDGGIEQVIKFWSELLEAGKFEAEQVFRFSGECAEPIAIVGMACRLPMANDIESFWKVLLKEEGVVRSPPEHRWSAKQHSNFPSDLEKPQAGFLSVPIDQLDVKFFEISPKDAVFMDPQHRLLLEVVWESLENSLINPLELRGTRSGLFLGTWANDYKDILGQDRSSSDAHLTYKGNCVGAGAARISHFLGFSGPSVGVESDCSAGLTSVHLACKSLQSGECSTAVACAASLATTPFNLARVPTVLSPDFRCKTFDESANGFARAEGVASLVLKKYSEAVKDGNQIWGLIRGSAISHEGTSPSMGSPTTEAQAEVMQLALKNANLLPHQVSHVEAHGTGTSVGDPVEMASIQKAYGSPERTQELVVSSVKTIVGHTESCSGLTGLIKVVLSMKHELIPAHLNFKKLNPKINLETKVKIPVEATPWPRSPKSPRFAGVSSYGIVGNNCHVVVGEPPLSLPPSPFQYNGDRPLHILKITSKSEPALNELLEKYKTLLELSPEINFADLAYSANTGRADFNHRAVITAENREAALNNLNSGNFQRNEVLSFGSGICFLFPGQGCQYHGMSKKLYESSPIFKNNFDFCNDWIQTRYHFSIKQVYFDEEKENINKTLYSQVGIFIVEYSLMKLWLSWGVKPRFVVGHSLGEFCAAVCAGVLDVEEALKLVVERSLLIEQLPAGKMLVIKGNKEMVENLQKQFYSNLDYAGFNSTDQTVVAGRPEMVLAFYEFLKSQGIKSTLLQSSHAFHSRDMDPILGEFKKIANGISYKKPLNGIQFISGMFGKETNEINADYWVQHARDPVNFLKACDTLQEKCSVYLEVGPHPILSPFLLANEKNVAFPSLRKNTEDWNCLFNTLGKLYMGGFAKIDWKGVEEHKRNKFYKLPTYPFQRTRFWPKIPNNNKTKHPMLGKRLGAPIRTALFECEGFEELSYLKDHMVQEKVIFPGAGFIELMLAAGATHFYGREATSTIFQCPSRPIILQGLRIHSPLELNEQVGSVMAVLETETTCDGFPVSISHDIGGQNWVSHATAFFHPHSNPSSFNKILETFQNCKENLNVLNNFKINENKRKKSTVLKGYDRNSRSGIHFEQSFRTLDTVWTDPERGELLAEVTTPKSNENYLLHPILFDAMIQTGNYPHEEVLGDGEAIKEKNRFEVPVGIDQVTWFRPLTTEKCFVYSPNTRLRSVFLFDLQGSLVAFMDNLQMIETTADNMKAVVNDNHGKSLPGLYQQEWKSNPLGPCLHRLDYTKTMDVVEIAKKANSIVLPSPEEEQRMEDVNKLVSLYTLKTLQELGSPSKIGEEVDPAWSLPILDTHQRLVSQLLRYLQEDGWIENEENLRIKTDFPSVEDLQSEIASLIEKNCPGHDSKEEIDLEQVPILLLHQMGQHLCKILQGKEQPLPLVYPLEEKQISARRQYEMMFQKGSETISFLWKEHVEKLFKAYKGTSIPTLKILEVGAGTGVASSFLLELLQESGIPFEYFYTDISSGYFPAAGEKFCKFGEKIKFKKLDLEKDPTSQGFPPGYFDVVLAYEVLHVTKDIKQTVRNIRLLLAPGGNLWLGETVGGDRAAMMTFGVLEGFWRFEDFELRKDHCMLSQEKWEMVLKENGFSDLYSIPMDNGLYAMILARADQFGPFNSTPNQEEPSETNLPRWIIFTTDAEEEYSLGFQKYFGDLKKEIIVVKASYKESLKEIERKNIITANYSKIEEKLAEMKKNSTPWIFKGDIEGILVLWGLDKTERNQERLARPYLKLIQALGSLHKIPPCYVITTGQFNTGEVPCINPFPATITGITITAVNEQSNLNLRILDVDPRTDVDSSVKVVIQEVFANFEKQLPFISIFRGGNKIQPELALVKDIEPSLALPSGSDRFQLRLPESRVISELEFQPLEAFHLKGNEVEVKVHSCALNFRDLLHILKPTDDFAKQSNLLSDIAGVVTGVGSSVRRWKVGDEVFAGDFGDYAYPSHVKLSESQLGQVPPGWTLTEAACIPIAFTTAYHSIVEVAKARAEEVILIHTGSGGVGLVAVQVARELNLQIICTAGSERKRSYLRSLGISHVFNSRNTDYSKKIMEVTEGRGVDIVLNSITGPGFKEATLAACANKARFIELSKMNIWTEEEVNHLRPDVFYEIIDVSKGLDGGPMKQLIETVSKWMNEGKLRPIPFTRFDVVDIRQALGYLQKTKQIGKVVVAFPEKIHPQGVIPIFNKNSSYLITGGLGGIGLEVCKWMLDQGARNIVLVGRSPPQKDASDLVSNLMKKFPCKITILQGDVGSFESCKEILKSISPLAPLRGVMHAAGTLSDRTIEKISWTDFENTFRSKVDGSWNLHELTKNLPLEHFILFSSVVSTLGAAGQASHVAGCKFQDALAHHRTSLGLPSTTINWGHWGEVGVAKNKQVKLVNPISVRQGINALDHIMRKNLSAIHALHFKENLQSMIEPFPYIKWILSPEVYTAKVNPSKTNLSRKSLNNFWNEFTKSGENSLQIVQKYVEQMIKIVLCLDTSEPVNKHADLSQMGMDSLMLIELFNLMQDMCGNRVSLSQAVIRECKTLQALSTQLVEMIENSENSPSESVSVEQVKKLSLEDAVLPEDIQQEVYGSHVAPSQIKSLLLTGSTGNLGAHVLKQLLNYAQLQTIYCLIRGDAPERLASVLKRNEIPEMFKEKLKPISGDFSKKNFGMPIEEYSKLCREIDAIFHSGASVHHVEYYQKACNSMRSVNVEGLLNVLRFACKSKTKHVFHASSLVTAWDLAEDGRLGEDWPNLNRLSDVDTCMGYPVSKIVNDVHLKQSLEERGIPVKSFRYPELFTETGVQNLLEKSHTMKLAMFCLNHGVAPDDPYAFNLITVQSAAKATVSVVFNDEAPNGIYNVFHPQTILVRKCIREIAAQLGRPLESVAFEEFSKHVVRKCEEARKKPEGEVTPLSKAVVNEFQMVYKDKKMYGFFLNFTNKLFELQSNCDHFWMSAKLQKFAPCFYSEMEAPDEILKRGVKAAIEQGFLNLI